MFIKRFVKPVVGVATFNNRIKVTRRPANTLFTKTDEAFALLMLENNWDRWIDIFKLSDNRIPSVKRHRDGEEKVSISHIRPKYTDGGISYSDESASSSTKGRGWSEEGRAQFNVIVDMVNKSRRDHPNFPNDFVKKEREKINNDNQQKKKHLALIKNVVVPAHDKFCDDNEECVSEQVPNATEFEVTNTTSHDLEGDKDDSSTSSKSSTDNN